MNEYKSAGKAQSSNFYPTAKGDLPAIGLAGLIAVTAVNHKSHYAPTAHLRLAPWPAFYG
ncbi:hypothetical protein GCM10022421_18430 [Oceanisphaera sediminis]|uniref:Uncharacterized protein n=1 Tax=Oceanisphaera sediminis TaxID=981381 RepID=A0ABP7DXM8_9GAMM